MIEPTVQIEITTRPATLDDVEAVVELFNACSLALVGTPEFSVGELRGDWEMPGFDLSDDTLVVLNTAGELIGYGDLWGGSTNFVRLTSWVRVHPGYKGRGIGTYLNRWVEERARRDLDRAPEGARVVLLTHVFGGDRAARQLLEDLGMQAVRYAWQMEIELDQAPQAPQWPGGISVRLGRPGEEEVFYQARCDAFRDHWGYVEEPFEEGFARWWHLVQGEDYYDPSLWFLAEEGDQVAGFAICQSGTIDDPERGWVNYLGVLRPWRRRGLGLALLQHCFGEFFRRGIHRAGLGVDADSLTGATRLYEKAGMRPTEEYATYEKELHPGQELRTQGI